jgi:hypothetical protein
LDATEQFGELTQGGLESHLLPVGTVRRSGNDGAGRQVSPHAGLSGCLGAATDGQVILHAYLAGQHDPVAKLGAAGDAGLGDDEAVVTGLDVVPDLDEVVHLRSCPNGRLTGRRAVDGGVRTDPLTRWSQPWKRTE